MNFSRRLLALILPFLAALLSVIPAARARQNPNAPAQNTTPTSSSAAATNTTDATANADLTFVSVSVTDEHGRYLTGLSREAFTVFDGRERREIVSFSAEDAPETIGVVLDASGSMFSRVVRSKSKFARIRNSLLRFFRGCNAGDEFFLIAFNQSAQLLLDTSNDPAAVLAAIDRYAVGEPKGQTALYDALYLALDRVARGHEPRRALLLVTDGQDNVSKYTIQEVRQALKESDAIVYSVALLDSEFDSQLDFAGHAVLQDLAAISGGGVFYARNDEEINAAMTQVAAELRARYTVAFVPAPASNKSGWHEVKLKLGELRDAHGKKVKPVVRARAGFYDAAPAR